MARRSGWDTELYEAQHSFVWKMGEALLAMLDAQRGERVLDLGCGTGQLTNAVAQTGAAVMGVDSSPEMIGQARQNFPRIPFLLQDAVEMSFSGEFDAVFSNAALHWMTEARAVAERIAGALRPGGRLVAEFGGKGNIGHIEEAIRLVLRGYEGGRNWQSRYYFPSVGEYAGLLESAGFEVRWAMLFERPTPLEGVKGMEQWMRQFAWHYFERLKVAEQGRAVEEVVERLRPTLWRDGGWMADYRRLRILARKI